MSLTLDLIAECWGWSGLQPVEVLDISVFGNIAVAGIDGQIWRIVPEDLSCDPVARDDLAWRAMLTDPAMRADWDMSDLRDAARRLLGAPGTDHVYHFVTPPVLGGDYSVANIRLMAVDEQQRFAGDLARQVKDLPEGTQIRLDLRD